VSKFEVTFSRPAMAKPRPRGTGNQFYMPPDYMAWKENIAQEILLLCGRTHFEGPIHVAIVIGKDSFTVKIEESHRTRHGRADLDNLVGGVLDSIQDGGLIDNDRNVTEVEAWYDTD
jgi:Holliday junction resolvase RusA-like endonuclease